MRERERTITEEEAKRYIPILEFIRASSTRKGDKVSAANVLRELRNVKGWGQMFLSSKDMKLFEFVEESFPGGTDYEGEQFKLL